MINIMIFASGTGSNFENIAKYERESQVKLFNIKGLVVDKEHCKAREKARKLGIPEYFINPKNYLTKKEFEEKIIELLEKDKVELIVLAGYMRIIGETLLNKYSGKIINIHPSLLPKYQGKDALIRAYENKEKEIGVTVHYVDSGIDTGEIIAQESIELEPDLDFEKVEEYIHKIEHRLYPKVIREVCENIKSDTIPQSGIMPQNIKSGVMPQKETKIK